MAKQSSQHVERLALRLLPEEAAKFRAAAAALGMSASAWLRMLGREAVGLNQKETK